MNSVLPAVLFRRRNGWEAADMGVFLWRANWFPVLLFMGIPATIFFSVTLILANKGNEWINLIGILFIWWIKPLLDRFGLHVVSVRFFEPRSAFYRLFRGLGKTVRTGLVGDLLWRRFSPFRSARMPLLVLERLKGKNYKRRKQLLNRNGLGFGLPLTVICIGMALTLNAGELVFLNSIFNLINGNYRSVFEFIGEENNLVSILSFINLILIETLYVSMGFGLYINSRVETEGWDIELLFKTCVEKTRRSHKAGLTVPVLVLLFLFTGVPARSQEEHPGEILQSNNNENTEAIRPELLKPNPLSEKEEGTLKRILDSPDFGSEEPSRKIQFKKSEIPSGDGGRFKQFSAPFLKEIMGWILRFIIGVAVIAALVIGGYYAYRHRSRLFPGITGGKNSILKDPLQEDTKRLLKQAEELHRKGRIREGWSLCFRAFISVFSKLLFFPFPAEATEYEALVLVRKNFTAVMPDKAGGIDGFETFIHHWITFAYGGKDPAPGSFEEALASCTLLLKNQEGST